MSISLFQLVNDKEKIICYIKELQVRLTAKDTERAQLVAKLEEQKTEALKVFMIKVCSCMSFVFVLIGIISFDLSLQVPYWKFNTDLSNF